MKKSKKNKRKREGLRLKREHLSTRMQQRLVSAGHKFVRNPDGELKMSEVLLDFVEPLMEFNKDDNSFKKIIILSILVWNLCLNPEDEQEKLKKEIINSMVDEDPETCDTIAQIVEMLMERKRTEFADIKRSIIDYEIVNTEDGPRLNVSSTFG